MTLVDTDFWKEYYTLNRDPKKESMFANFVEGFINQNERLVEIGCGNGRDSIFFSSKGTNTTGIDQIEDEIEYLNSKYGMDNSLSFIEGNMECLPEIDPIMYLYSRFSIHSVNRSIEDKVFEWAKETLMKGGLFFIEARSINDELYGEGDNVGKHEFVTDHYRRFIDPREMREKAIAHGFSVIYEIESQGLAPYKTEDPAVVRFVFQK